MCGRLRHVLFSRRQRHQALHQREDLENAVQTCTYQHGEEESQAKKTRK
jgi:hypothetical protein